MQNKNLKNLFMPNRAAFFAGEAGGGAEKAEKNTPRDAPKEIAEAFEQKLETVKTPDDIKNVLKKAEGDLNEHFKSVESYSPDDDSKESLEAYYKNSLGELYSIAEKYSQKLETQKREFEKSKQEIAKNVVGDFDYTQEDLGGENVVEVKLNTPEDYRKNAKQYVDEGGRIDFKGDKAAEKAVRLVDIVKNPGPGDKAAVTHKGVEIIASYDADKKDFVDDKGKHVPIVSGDKIETGVTVAARDSLGEKKKAEVPDLESRIFPEKPEVAKEEKKEKPKGPKQVVEQDPELKKYRDEAVAQLEKAQNALVDQSAAVVDNPENKDKLDYIVGIVDAESKKIDKAIHEVGASWDLAEMLVNKKDLGDTRGMEYLVTARDYIANPDETAKKIFAEAMKNYDEKAKLAKNKGIGEQVMAEAGKNIEDIAKEGAEWANKEKFEKEEVKIKPEADVQQKTDVAMNNKDKPEAKK